ncbi:hypothetical protein PR003_g34407 [Phytophthora rubi]|uniref:Uncharacterized protein n=1 Tax=Phytophthora rubi TaxID=129364 RepID=A0A6A3G6V2_9STRA|nr:hypothetical protein PR001_g33505 [Phytophthora rubi]KAE8952441.1 hypothetical protein PR002_g32678 [Phytophthora rubi]KAE9260356.1 hypothetical protein PR003_g34407 [Phytophthora rubi]
MGGVGRSDGCGGGAPVTPGQTEPGEWAEDEVNGQNGRWVRGACLKLGESVQDVRWAEGQRDESGEADSHSRICGEPRRPHYPDAGERRTERTDGTEGYGAATCVRAQAERDGLGQQ